MVVFSLLASASAVPHYRLFTNLLGGGKAKEAAYFTQDDLYDAQIKPVMNEIALRAKPAARVATEVPTVCAYYANQFGRPDLSCISLSDARAVSLMAEGDFVVAARGRHYLSNGAVLTALAAGSKPSFSQQLREINTADVYVLDQTSAQRISAAAQPLAAALPETH